MFGLAYCLSKLNTNPKITVKRKSKQIWKQSINLFETLEIDQSLFETLEIDSIQTNKNRPKSTTLIKRNRPKSTQTQEIANLIREIDTNLMKNDTTNRRNRPKSTPKSEKSTSKIWRNRRSRNEAHPPPNRSLGRDKSLQINFSKTPFPAFVEHDKQFFASQTQTLQNSFSAYVERDKEKRRNGTHRQIPPK